jgi:hypothetical protein
VIDELRPDQGTVYGSEKWTPPAAACSWRQRTELASVYCCYLQDENQQEMFGLESTVVMEIAEDLRRDVEADC